MDTIKKRKTFSTAKLFKILMTTELTVDESGVGYYCIPSH